MLSVEASITRQRYSVCWIGILLFAGVQFPGSRSVRRDHGAYMCVPDPIVTVRFPIRSHDLGMITRGCRRASQHQIARLLMLSCTDQLTLRSTGLL